MANHSSAIDYFNENAQKLSAEYNAVDRAQVHSDLLQFLPSKKLHMLDIGAGSGADANMFAAMGHEVVAVEPAQTLRDLANKTFQNKNIKWCADDLPALTSVKTAKEKFDVIYSVGTIQYLDEAERTAALKTMVSLLKDDGLIEVQYPTPPSREHQFRVGLDEVKNFVAAFNKKAKDGRQLQIVRENIKAISGRKARDGTDLYFNTTIIKSVKTPHA